MPDWLKAHKVWTDARTKHGVKGGAVPGVNVGDAIERVQKAYAKGYGPLVVEAASLVATLKKYREKSAKSAPKFADWIEKVIEKDAKQLLDEAKADKTSLDWIIKECLPNAIGDAQALFPNEDGGRRADLLAKEKPPMTWVEAAKVLSIFGDTAAYGPVIAQRSAKLKTVAWRIALPGKDADYVQMAEFAETMLSDVKFSLKWMKVTDGNSFALMQRALLSQNTVKIIQPYAVRAAKSLMG